MDGFTVGEKTAVLSQSNPEAEIAVIESEKQPFIITGYLDLSGLSTVSVVELLLYFRDHTGVDLLIARGVYVYDGSYNAVRLRELLILPDTTVIIRARLILGSGGEIRLRLLKLKPDIGIIKLLMRGIA